MKKLYCWILVLALLFSGCTQTDRGEKPSVNPDDSDTVPEAEKLLKTLSSAKYQGRAVGGAGNELAAEYIASQFEAYGLEPLENSYLLPYEEQCVRTEQAEAHAAIIAADGTRTELTAGTDFVFSPVCEGVEVALPISEDAAACADGAAFFYAEDVQEARSFSNQEPGSFSVACTDLEEYTGLNSNTRDKGTFLLLAETYCTPMRAEGTKLELSLSPCLEEGTASNVAAVLRGSEGKSAFIVGAHFDGSGICGQRRYPSAYDNASGLVAMLETARLLAGAELKNDLIFVAFNGEESGNDGATAFANQVLEGYERINLFNFDCVGHRDSVGYTVFDNYGLNAALKTALLTVLGEQSTGGDDLPSDGRVFNGFSNVSYVSVADGSFETLFNLSPIHTSMDLPEQIDFTRIRELANAVAEVIRAGVLYDQDPELLAQGPDEWTGLMPAETKIYNQLIEDGTLKTYTQAYVYNTEGDGSKVLTGSMKSMLSAEELEAACPGLGIPESIGDYRFVYASLQGLLDGVQRYDLRVKLQEVLEVGTLIDVTGRIVPHLVEVYYLASDGRGIHVFIGPTTEDAFAETEDGATLDQTLKGVRLMHAVNPQFGLDGYWRLAVPCENERVIYIGFYDGASLVRPVTGWEDNFHRQTYERYLKPDELLAEFAALDLTPLQKVCEQIKDF